MKIVRSGYISGFDVIVIETLKPTAVHQWSALLCSFISTYEG